MPFPSVLDCHGAMHTRMKRHTNPLFPARFPTWPLPPCIQCPSHYPAPSGPFPLLGHSTARHMHGTTYLTSPWSLALCTVHALCEQPNPSAHPPLFAPYLFLLAQHREGLMHVFSPCLLPPALLPFCHAPAPCAPFVSPSSTPAFLLQVLCSLCPPGPLCPCPCACEWGHLGHPLTVIHLVTRSSHRGPSGWRRWCPPPPPVHTKLPRGCPVVTGGPMDGAVVPGLCLVPL